MRFIVFSIFGQRTLEALAAFSRYSLISALAPSERREPMAKESSIAFSSLRRTESGWSPAKLFDLVDKLTRDGEGRRQNDLWHPEELGGLVHEIGRQRLRHSHPRGTGGDGGARARNRHDLRLLTRINVLMLLLNMGGCRWGLF